MQEHNFSHFIETFTLDIVGQDLVLEACEWHQSFDIIIDFLNPGISLFLV
jgi:hypothetical protein